jgi:hypothetical protein
MKQPQKQSYTADMPTSEHKMVEFGGWTVPMHTVRELRKNIWQPGNRRII